jgi:nucleoid-associated protein YgaU
VYGVGALLALSVLVLGVPWLIVSWGEWRALAEVVRHPSVLFGADDGRVIMGLLTLVGAVAWVVLAFCVLVEVVAWARSRDRPAEPRGWLRVPRGLVRPLIAAVFSMTMAMGSSHSMAAPVDAPIVFVDEWYSETATVADDLRIDTGVAEPQAPAHAVMPEASHQAANMTTVIVAPGDTLWSIAERAYNDGTQWKRIAEANADLISGDVICVGWSLKIPPLSPSVQTDPLRDETPSVGGDAQGNSTIVVEEGDCLWDLAQTHLGDPLRWPDIMEMNTHVITDPDVIQPGWVLNLPSAGVPTAVPTDAVAIGEEPVRPDSTSADTPPGTAGTITSSATGETVEGHSTSGESVVESGSEPAAESVGASLDGAASGEVDPRGGILGESGPIQPAPGEGESAGVGPSDVPAMPADVPPAAPADGSQETADSAHGQESPGESSPSPAIAMTGLGVLLAAGVGYVLRKRRQNQLRERPLGRRIPHPSVSATRLETALGNQADQESPLQDRLGPPTDSARVIVGLSDAGETHWADLEEAGTLTLAASEPDDLDASMTAACLGLASGGWAKDVEVHLVTAHPEVFSGFETVVLHGSPSEALGVLRTTVTDRREGLSGRSLADARREGAEAFRPMVFAFADFNDPVSTGEVAQLLKPNVGVSALVTSTQSVITGAGVSIDQSRRAILHPSGLGLTPSLLDDRDLVAELLKATLSLDTTPAWWSADHAAPAASDANFEDPEMMIDWEEPPIPPTDPDPPTLFLLGPVELREAKGTPPVRAERSCIEYCCWLLEHPGATPAQMAQGLMVAESTRRSTMSRLRTWLGADSADASYLPEAYSGRIRLSVHVTSDWARLRHMIRLGVERTDTETLMECLRLVRGEPLEDVAPFGWHWSEELRTDMVSVIRDIGIVVARRCLSDGRPDEARWACERALLGAPEDERLLCTWAEIEQEEGNNLQMVRLATRITRNARIQGVDLLPDTEQALRRMARATSHVGV